LYLRSSFFIYSWYYWLCWRLLLLHFYLGHFLHRILGVNNCSLFFRLAIALISIVYLSWLRRLLLNLYFLSLGNLSLRHLRLLARITNLIIIFIYLRCYFWFLSLLFSQVVFF
jgi:hypothetical protein